MRLGAARPPSVTMPEVSRFYGISIRIELNDHNPPHFHAIYGGRRASVSIEGNPVVRGRGFPLRASRMVREWALIHQEELLAAWERARNAESPGRIDPLP